MNVPENIREQVRAVRDDGAVNMISANEVQVRASQMNLNELVMFIEDLRGDRLRIRGEDWMDFLNSVEW